MKVIAAFLTILLFEPKVESFQVPRIMIHRHNFHWDTSRRNHWNRFSGRVTIKSHNDDNITVNVKVEASSPSPSPSPSTVNTFLADLLSRFQGDFDNYQQVVSDRERGLLPRDGGGHEHIHCTLLPVPSMHLHLLPDHLFDRRLGGNNEKEEDGTIRNLDNEGAVIAAYYFDGMPNRIFRIRLYTLCSNDGNGDKNSDDEGESIVRMKLYCLSAELEGKLRAESAHPIQHWNRILCQHLQSSSSSSSSSSSFVELERCDVHWTIHPDPIRHAYLHSSTDNHTVKDEPYSNPYPDPSDAYHAKMIHDHDEGGVLLESQMTPGTFIRVRDELSLWDSELWINDRGCDAQDISRFVYGNYRGVPYQMMRVATLVTLSSLSSSSVPLWKEGQVFERKVTDEKLAWTLGEAWRTNEEYEKNMERIGGVSTRMNSNSSPSSNS